MLELAEQTDRTFDADLDALVAPPPGWIADPLKKSDRHAHRVWLSPTRDTAYGVIHFTLPWPVGPDMALWGFLNEMKKSEGESKLLSKEQDKSLPGLRFVAEGGLYTVRGNMTVRGWEGWTVYAGTSRKREVRADELEMAQTARDHTAVGPPRGSGASAGDQ